MEVSDNEKERIKFAFGCYFKGEIPFGEIKSLWSNWGSYIQRSKGDNFFRNLLPLDLFNKEFRDARHKESFRDYFMSGILEHDAGVRVNFGNGHLHPQTLQNLYGKGAEVDLMLSSHKGIFIDAEKHIKNALKNLEMRVGREHVVDFMEESGDYIAVVDGGKDLNLNERSNVPLVVVQDVVAHGELNRAIESVLDKNFLNKYSDITPKRSSFSFIGERYNPHSVGGSTPHLILKANYIKEFKS